MLTTQQPKMYCIKEKLSKKAETQREWAAKLGTGPSLGAHSSLSSLKAFSTRQPIRLKNSKVSKEGALLSHKEFKFDSAKDRNRLSLDISKLINYCSP
mmetsp:Transcript_29509/g.29129  ORF Transcript_29509/g.29129 Transcript_29509/m.29129 type:complete len:98 (+) Transcript_29509:878-1171(+)